MSLIPNSTILFITSLCICLLITLLTSKSLKLRVKLLNGKETKGEFS